MRSDKKKQGASRKLQLKTLLLTLLLSLLAVSLVSPVTATQTNGVEEKDDIDVQLKEKSSVQTDYINDLTSQSPNEFNQQDSENSSEKRNNSDANFNPGCKNDIALGGIPILQPVQTVWLDDPDWDKGNPTGDLFPTGNTEGGYSIYQSALPMVKGKKTKLFGFHYQNFKHFSTSKYQINLVNYYPEKKEVSVTLSSNDPSFEYTPSKTWTLPAAEVNEDRKCHSAKKTVQVSVPIPKKGLPKEPFEFKNTSPNLVDASIKIKAEVVNPGGSPISDTGPKNNYDKVRVDVPVVDTGSLNILYLPVKYEFQKDIKDQKLTRFSEKSTELMKGMYPVDEDRVKGWISYQGLSFGEKPEKDEDLVKEFRRVVMKLHNMGVKLNYDKVVGVTHENGLYKWWGHIRPGFDGAGGASAPEITKVGVFATTEYPVTTPHEIGHTYGLYLDKEEYELHPPGHPANGYWVTKDKKMDDKTSFMGGSGALSDNPYKDINYWADKCDYKHIIVEMANGNPKFRPTPKTDSKSFSADSELPKCGLSKYTVPGNGQKSGQISSRGSDLTGLQNTQTEIISVTGVVSETGENGEFDKRFYRVKGTPDTRLGKTEGNYSIVFLDGNQELDSTKFNVSSKINGLNISTSLGFFGLRIPWVNGTKKIELRNEDGDVLATKEISSNPPTISDGSVSETNSGVTVSWTGNDGDGDELVYDVMVGNKTESIWNAVALNTTKTSVKIDGEVAENHSDVRILANDGLNTAEKTMELPGSGDGGGDGEKSILEAIAGSNNKIEFSELQQAIVYWSQNQSVPDTGGKKIDFAKLQEIISIWIKGTEI